MQKTPLHDSHLNLGAKMGEFAGYDMPLFYKEGVKAEHLWTREKAGLFDVSHMGQVIIEGAEAVALLHTLTPSTFTNLKPNVAKYTVLTNKEGGIIDDLIVTKLSDTRFFAVINAGCKEKDIKWIEEHLPETVELKYLKDRALIALQGPLAERILHDTLYLDILQLGYMRMVQIDELFISRLGYTGEDGFEISVPAEHAPALWERFLEHEDVKPIGLAARDSLRLEMGYCLYGHDIDEKTSPVEADLSWVIGKDADEFIGSSRIINERDEGASKKRVGIKLIDKGVAREGAELYSGDDKKIGAMTSGGFSPSLEVSIGQGYVDTDYADEGTEIFVDVRGRRLKAEIASMPFLKPNVKIKKKVG